MCHRALRDYRRASYNDRAQLAAGPQPARRAAPAGNQPRGKNWQQPGTCNC
jgi:hypothetical protein